MILRPLLALLLLTAPLSAEGWWDPAWTARQALTIDTAADAALASATGPANVLVRLHDGNFQFMAAAEGGADLRFVSEDGSVVYPHHVEKYDSLINEAFVWVKVPEISPGESQTLWVYYGNAAPDAGPTSADAYDQSTGAVFHFSEPSGAPVDSTTNANSGGSPGTGVEGAIIGNGLRLIGGDPVTIPASPSLAWTQGGEATISLWIHPAELASNAVVLSRGEGAASFRLLLDQGVPLVEAGGVRSSPGEPLPVGVWSHVTVVAGDGVIRVFVNGGEYALAQAPLPGLNSPITLGGPSADAPSSGTRFSGDIDELRFDKIARSAGWVKFVALSQGTTDSSQRLVALGGVETGEGGGEAGHGSALEHVMLFGDIAKNMMFDGWIAIGVCVLMIIAGWTVAIRKFTYLNSIEKGTNEFLRLWKNLSSDLTAIDHSDAKSVSSLGGIANAETESLIRKSPLYGIYHIGSEEIRHRLDSDRMHRKGLTGRSIQAIRASLDGGMVHETHRLTDGLVLITMSIAGGPYVGLLGTVVGVMITFAIISKSGEVDVNSIAPGIASALLATVAGLIVAIPALFIYSYLNSRIKKVTGVMQVFIDEFVAKMAEFYQGSDNTGSVNKSAD